MYGEDLQLSDRRPRRQGRAHGLHAAHQRHLRVRGRRLRGAHGGRDIQNAGPSHPAQHLRYRFEHTDRGNRGAFLIICYLSYFFKVSC